MVKRDILKHNIRTTQKTPRRNITDIVSGITHLEADCSIVAAMDKYCSNHTETNLRFSSVHLEPRSHYNQTHSITTIGGKV